MGAYHRTGGMTHVGYCGPNHWLSWEGVARISVVYLAKGGLRRPAALGTKRWATLDESSSRIHPSSREFWPEMACQRSVYDELDFDIKTDILGFAVSHPWI